MADIQLRFNRDLLVLSSPVRSQLQRIGVNTDRDGDMTLLLEPEVYEEIYALECAAGAQCLVADTASLTPARLAHSRLEDAGAQLARTALQVVRMQNPQHVLVELGPCGLPLDVSSKASLNEVRDQYSRSALFFEAEEEQFDAYFLNGFSSCAELRCALMGLRKMTDKPVFASVDLIDVYGEEGEAVTTATGDGIECAARLAERPAETLCEAIAVMAEYGAQVVGFRTTAAPGVMRELAQQVRAAVSLLPILVQMDVRRIDLEQKAATPENPYFEPDVMVEAADVLAAGGVQFMRAVGAATPSYTGALVAATIGDTVNRPELMPEETIVRTADPAALADMLRARVNKAIGNN